MSTLHTKLDSFFETHNVLNLAYIDLDREVQSCALWYVHNPKLEFFFLTAMSTKHGKSLVEGGEIAFTINRDNQPWDSIRGVQGKGYVNRLVEREEIRDSWELYRAKYKFIDNQFPQLEEALNKTKIWKIKPSWLRLIDNSIGFGHKEELTFS